MNRKQKSTSPEVFISYAFEEAEFANQLVAELNAAGIQCWLDTNKLRGGVKWQPALGQAILDSFALVVITTRKSLDSQWVQNEINFARTNAKPIIPLIQEDVTNHPAFIALSSDQWISDHSGDNHSKAIARLARDLQQIRAELHPASTVQRQKELAYLDALEVENLREVYTAMASRSEQQFRHYGHRERRLKVELLPLGKDGALQPKKEEFPDAVEAMLAVRRAALLGEPGGGKSTAIFRLAMDLAEAARHDDVKPIPVLALLREWQSADQSLPEFIAEQMDLMHEGAGACLETLLCEQRAAILLDGLNELPVDQRRDKYAQVCQFIAQHSKLIAIVSCRKEDYPPELGFDCINISPLDPIRIRQFARNYLERPELGDELFWELAGIDARWTHRQFLQAFGDNLPNAEEIFWLNSQLPDGMLWGWEWEHEGKKHKNNSLWESWVKRREEPSGLMTLASNPFMLNMLISVFKENQGELPQNRGELFRNFIRIRLEREREGERIEAHEIQPLQEKLAEVAFALQSRRANDDGEGGAVIVLPKSEVVSILGENHVRSLYLASSAGLLSTDDPVRFTHQLLQEYFAAQHLDIRFRAGDWKATEIWKPERWWERTNWEVAAVLFTGLYSNDCSEAIEWIAAANPEVAAQCLISSGVGHTLSNVVRERLRKRWIERLTDLKNDPEPKARAAVGHALGMLPGWDTRKGVGVVKRNGLVLPDIEWIRIPEGEFQYGDENGYAAEPQKLWLPEFHISRYPVTSRQFKTFLDDPEGFNDQPWFEGFSKSRKDYRHIWVEYGNYPSYGVDWYQAMAFCSWLSWRLDQISGRVSTATGRERQFYDLKNINKWTARLPTEFEWEKAARGFDGRLYPCKGDFDSTKSNVAGTGIGQASAVGIFPNGASVFGVDDMSGNVWEWCLTDFSKPQIEAGKENLQKASERVLRGGSWEYDQWAASAVIRYHSDPGFRDDDIGFRVVLCCPPSS